MTQPFRLSPNAAARVVFLDPAPVPEFRYFTMPLIRPKSVGVGCSIKCGHAAGFYCPLCAPPTSTVTGPEPPVFAEGTYVWSSIAELRPVIQGSVIGSGKRGTLLRLLDPIPWLPKDRQWEVDVPSLKLEKPSLLDRLAFEERMVPAFRRGFRPRLTKAQVLLGL